MTKKGLRGFAIGLFVATTIFSIFYYTSTEESQPPPKMLDPAEMKTELEASGYVVLSSQEYEELLKSEESIPPPQTEKQEPTEQTDESENGQVFYAYISIQPGMTSSQVATQLERAKIIQSKAEFISYMESNKLNGSIRTGEYQLNSSMSIAEIAATIT